MGSRDPKGFYAVLNVGPTASQMEIRLAYKFLKSAYRDGKKLANIGKIRSAYLTLADPKLRAQYDGHAAGQSATALPAPRRSRLHSVPLLVATSALFLVALGFVFDPGIMSRWVTFEAGDELIWKQTSKRLGEVLEFEEAHDFPEAATQAAYKVRMSSGVAQWFPAGDLHRGTTTR